MATQNSRDLVTALGNEQPRGHALPLVNEIIHAPSRVSREGCFIERLQLQFDALGADFAEHLANRPFNLIANRGPFRQAL